MVDEIQLVIVGDLSDVVTDATVKNDSEKVAELVINSGYQNWTVALNKADYLTSLSARHYSAMFSDGRNKKKFNRRSTWRTLI